MFSLTASQIKAARALLDWSQAQLADATLLSRSTIRCAELGYVLRPHNMEAIRQVFIAHGIAFEDGDGVRRISTQKARNKHLHTQMISVQTIDQQEQQIEA
ncbi:helix-turn-helix domain-containing protein [Hyphomicrobium sp.]|jgi:transcriptional regulator with XRE-family HTH domain|uniref:helix-turn-helix domain-containing protein n=1 Tax=Hyphomicrobium sp. TaxID=82 RepID=UPI00356510A0